MQNIFCQVEEEYYVILPKTVAENWVSKQSWFVLILKPVHSWLKSYFFGNKTFFVFQDTKLKFSASV